LLSRQGFPILTAAPTDLVAVVEADSTEQAEQALLRIDDLLRPGVAARAAAPRTLDEALRRRPDANLLLVSTPGEYATREARQALHAGLHVFMFSDNVPLTDEVALKALARERGRLLMGPDCGTSILGGRVLGFGNVVRKGPVGLCGASGSGIQ